MDEKQIGFLNRKYAIDGLFVDLVFKPRHDVLGKAFDSAMEDAATKIRSFKTFDGHATVNGVDIGYEHLDITYAPKKMPLEHYVVKIHSDKKGFQQFQRLQRECIAALGESADPQSSNLYSKECQCKSDKQHQTILA